jgi:uncharacterized protein
LVKPVASAGGHGIRFWAGNRRNRTRSSRGFFFQQYIDGESCAAVYAASDRDTTLMGVSRQLVGEPWLHAAPFQYCGSVGPLDLDERVETAFARLGVTLVREFGLRGLFGVDCALRDGVPFPLEINPRYTASVEVLEYATGLVAMDCHRRAFAKEVESSSPHPLLKKMAKADRRLPHRYPRKQGNGNVVGKAILFARERVSMAVHAPWSLASEDPVTILPEFADIPYGGNVIEQGHPIVTLFASADTVASCMDELRQRVSSLDRWLFAR